jgi:dolichol kinase
VFALAILNVALADSAAAIAGQYLRGGTFYWSKRLGKTIEGTGVFCLVSAFLMVVASLCAGPYWPSRTVGASCVAGAAAGEGLSPWGIDNATVPLFVAIWLTCGPQTL